LVFQLEDWYSSWKVGKSKHLCGAAGIGQVFCWAREMAAEFTKIALNVVECRAEVVAGGLSGRNSTIVLAEFDDFMRCAGESCRYFFRLGS
jgi:hypothetical protein